VAAGTESMASGSRNKAGVQLTARPEWKTLQRHAATMRRRHLRDLFVADADRGEGFALEAAGLYFDYAKQRVDAQTLKLLLRLAGACGVRERTEAMFRGERINTTEDRAVLHVALRAPKRERIVVDDRDVVADVHAVLDRMAAFCERVRGGDWTSSSLPARRLSVTVIKACSPSRTFGCLAEKWRSTTLVPNSIRRRPPAGMRPRP